MKKFFLALAAIPMLAGCTTSAFSNLPAESPAPLQQTIIDDKAIVFAFQSFDMVLSLVDSAIDAKLIVPGSPEALRLKSHLQQTRYWLNAASAAQKAGSVSSYEEAFANAQRALAQAKVALRS